MWILGEVCRVTMVHLRVNVGHIRVAVGHPRVTIGHLRVTLEMLLLLFFLAKSKGKTTYISTADGC